MLRVQQELQEPKSRFFQKFSIGKAAVAQEAQVSKPLLPGGYTSQCFVFCDGRKKLLFGGIRCYQCSREGETGSTVEIFASKRQKLLVISCFNMFQSFFAKLVSFCRTLLFVLKARAGTLMRRIRKKYMELIMTGLFWVDNSLTLNSGFESMVW